ncbi:conserved oligomeric Golgi complex subunit 4-like, partial [Trifolium medium]|nr:conserved oligomeric Golgi complex subunit 4-like [Trifolium medium]
TQRERLLDVKKQLEGIVRKKLSSAVDQRDHPVILSDWDEIEDGV